MLQHLVNALIGACVRARFDDLPCSGKCSREKSFEKSKHWNFREKQFIQHVHARDRELPSLAQKKLECIIIAIIYGFTLQIWIPCSYQVIHDVTEALLGRRGGMHFAAQRQQVGL